MPPTWIFFDNEEPCRANADAPKFDAHSFFLFVHTWLFVFVERTTCSRKAPSVGQNACARMLALAAGTAAIRYGDGLLSCKQNVLPAIDCAHGLNNRGWQLLINGAFRGCVSAPRRSTGFRRHLARTRCPAERLLTICFHPPGSCSVGEGASNMSVRTNLFEI